MNMLVNNRTLNIRLIIACLILILHLDCRHAIDYGYHRNGERRLITNRRDNSPRMLHQQQQQQQFVIRADDDTLSSNNVVDSDPFFNTKILTEPDLQWDDRFAPTAPSSQQQQQQQQQPKLQRPIIFDASNKFNSLRNQPSNNNNNNENLISAKIEQIRKQNDWLFIFIVAACSIAAVVILVAVGVCWLTLNRSIKKVVPAASSAANHANIEQGIKMINSNRNNSAAAAAAVVKNVGDRRLAQSAQMYHYQHQKQQMIAMERALSNVNKDPMKPDCSDNSEGEQEDADFSVYECPGLAPTDIMEVRNPLFSAAVFDDDAIQQHQQQPSTKTQPLQSPATTNMIETSSLYSNNNNNNTFPPNYSALASPESSSSSIDDENSHNK